MTNRPAPQQHCDPRPLAERALLTPGETERPARSVTVNLAESPLSWLHARGHVTDRQRAAGELLRRDFERAQLSPHVTMRWDAAPAERRRRGAHEPLNATEKMISAKRRFDDALAALGPGLADIAWRVLCAGEAISGAERGLGWPQRSGKLVLRLALDRLADFYRLG